MRYGGKCWLLTLIGILSIANAVGSQQALEIHQPLPAMRLDLPATEAHRDYLGLTVDTETFGIGDIKADIVLIQIFSMYCPHCQREAPRVNQLYERIISDPSLKRQMRMIGIGAGNTTFEVDLFRKKKEIQFPLFADGDFVIHKAIGEVRTPYYIGVQLSAGNTQKVFFTHLGDIGEPQQFLETIVQKSRAAN
jgi:peroxiredoxin